MTQMATSKAVAEDISKLNMMRIQLAYEALRPEKSRHREDWKTCVFVKESYRKALEVYLLANPFDSFLFDMLQKNICFGDQVIHEEEFDFEIFNGVFSDFLVVTFPPLPPQEPDDEHIIHAYGSSGSNVLDLSFVDDSDGSYELSHDCEILLYFDRHNEFNHTYEKFRKSKPMIGHPGEIYRHACCGETEYISGGVAELENLLADFDG